MAWPCGGPPGLPHAESLAARWLSLPMHPALGQDGVRRVAAALQEALRNAPAGAPQPERVQPVR